MNLGYDVCVVKKNKDVSVYVEKSTGRIIEDKEDPYIYMHLRITWKGALTLKKRR